MNESLRNQIIIESEFDSGSRFEANLDNPYSEDLEGMHSQGS